MVQRVGIAVLRCGAFIALFFILRPVLSPIVLQALPLDALVLDTLATLIAAVIAGALLLKLMERRPVSDLGFGRDGLSLVPAGVALGAASIAIASLALVLLGALTYTRDSGDAGSWLAGQLEMFAILSVAAAAEEALFRGYPFQKLVEGFGAVAATVIASAAFAIAHARNPAINDFALINIFVAGVMLSVAYLRTRSLWFATAVHVGWNWCMAGLFDLPVSGLELFDAPLYEPRDRGPAWLSGGPFGPEAGAAGVFGLLVALAGVLWLTRKNAWQTSKE